MNDNRDEASVVSLATAEPFDAVVLERRDDGSSLVEVPILSVTPSIDLSKTEGGGKGKISFSVEDLETMVENFAIWTKPVGVGLDGFDGHQDERGGPQSVFVDALKVKNETLYAVMDANAFVTALLIDDRGYRGFSIEARKNPKVATRSFKGWVLTGGVFTNNPATDTQFKIAATGEVESDELVRVNSKFTVKAGDPAEVRVMADDSKKEKVKEVVKETPKVPSAATSVSLTYHDQEIGKLSASVVDKETQVTALKSSLKAAETRIEALRDEVTKAATSSVTTDGEKASLTATVNRLELENTALRTARDELSIKFNEQADELKKIRTETDASEVKGTIIQAIDAGVAPAVFDGWEADPAGWLTANFASLTSFKSHVTALTNAKPIVKGSATKSGHDPKTASEEAELQAKEETAASLAASGVKVDVDYVNVTSEKEARLRFAAAKENK